jgi:hypothetical protein
MTAKLYGAQAAQKEQPEADDLDARPVVDAEKPALVDGHRPRGRFEHMLVMHDSPTGRSALEALILSSRVRFHRP